MSTSRMLKRASQLVLAAAVIAGLSFGTSQLFASHKADCPYPPYHGPCTNGDCHDLCLRLFPDNNGEGVCSPSTQCCICAER